MASKEIRPVFAGIRKKIEQIADESVKSSFLKEMGEETIKTIVKRSQDGKRVSKGRNPKRISTPGLKDSTKKYRKRYRKNLSNKTSPEKDNFTATGQLMESMILKSFKGKFVIKIKEGQRTKTLSDGGTRKGRRKKALPTNDKVRKELEKMGRKFFAVTRIEKKELTQKFEKRIIKLVRKKFQ